MSTDKTKTVFSVEDPVSRIIFNVFRDKDDAHAFAQWKNQTESGEFVVIEISDEISRTKANCGHYFTISDLRYLEQTEGKLHYQILETDCKDCRIRGIDYVENEQCIRRCITLVYVTMLAEDGILDRAFVSREQAEEYSKMKEKQYGDRYSIVEMPLEKRRAEQ